MALTGSHALSPSHKKSCDELWPYGSFEHNKTPEKSCLRCGLSRGHLCRPFDQNWRGDCLTHNCSLPPSPQRPTVLYLPTCCWAVLTRHAQKLPVLGLTQLTKNYLTLKGSFSAGWLAERPDRLYRSQTLQVNMRLKVLAEIYTTHSFAQLCDLIFLSKFTKKFAKSCKIQQNN